MSETSVGSNYSKLEDSLWSAADILRANSKLTSSEYCMPVLGIIFLRHATNRYEAALLQIEADQKTGKMPKRPAIKADFLNMDIQGAELKCLKGFERNLGMINAIYAEVNEKELYAGCALLPELDAWLSEHGFVRVHTHMTPHGWGDALYIRQKTA